MATAVESIASGTEQTVIVRVADELYGIDITSVQEIIRVPAITRVPNGPSYAMGVTNLRGRIVPVMDLRAILDADAREQTISSRVVIIDLAGEDIGLCVDGVSEVLEVDPATVDPQAMLLWVSGVEMLRGVVKLEGRLIGLLDIDRLLSGAV